MNYTIEPIGILHSPYTDKFGIPRQPGLVPSAKATITLLPPYNAPDAVRGLEGFSHIWLSFVFHQHLGRGFSATVRPPRLGGNQRIGVFASRSSFRPNSMGQSVVPLLEVNTGNGQVCLTVSGIDLLDNTPIIDIKPYLPYSDSLPGAHAHFATQAPTPCLTVIFSASAESQCQHHQNAQYPELKTLITEILQQDPRPPYHQEDQHRQYGFTLYRLEVQFYVFCGTATVSCISSP